MTTDEFDREFDILYNSIMSNTAPSIDLYEKSVFLTKAQEELVVALYNGSFESNELITESLKTLIKSKSLDSATDTLAPRLNTELLTHNSKLFELPADALFIIYESILPYNKGEVVAFKVNPLEIEVTPIKHDLYSKIRKNPFKRASVNRALRATSFLTVSGGTEKEILEVIAAQELFVYKIRYIRKPKPIVLYNSPGLTINDLYDTPTDSELPESLHRVILEMAVKNAATIYKQ